MALTFNVNKNRQPYSSTEAKYDWLTKNGRKVNEPNVLNASGAQNDSNTQNGTGVSANGAYDPLGDLYNIVSRKQQWTDADKAKDKPTMEAAENYAKNSYDALRANGYGQYADTLANMDAPTASNYYNSVRSALLYSPDAGGVQNKSNDAYGDIKDSYDMVYRNNINVDPTSTDYGKNILAAYGAASDGAYAKTLGSGMEDAGGNVDSYAAAQANRNKASMLTQGFGTAREYYDSIAGASNTWAANKANSLQSNVNADWSAQAGREADALARYESDLSGQLARDEIAANERINNYNTDAEMLTNILSASQPVETKPRITASEAQTSYYKYGNRTPEVMEAMNYYYGLANPYGTQKESAYTEQTNPSAAGNTSSMGDYADELYGYDTSTAPSAGYNNEDLSTDEVMALQSALGVNADGYFGPASQSAARNAGYNSAREAYNAIFGSTGSTYNTVIGINGDGTFVLSGKTYNNVDDLVAAIQNGNYTDADKMSMIDQLDKMGYEVEARGYGD